MSNIENNKTYLLTPEQIADVIDFIFTIKLKKKIKKTCNKKYYKNQYLKYAVEHHSSIPCIVRTYAEMLKSGYIYTHNPNDMKHANRLISYLNVYTNKKNQKFVDTCFEKLEDKAQEKYDYLICKTVGRLKSFRSFECKLRTKIATSEILLELLENAEAILNTKYWQFQPEELTEAKKYLEKLIEKNKMDNPIRDLSGYRIIVNSYNTSILEEDLIAFIYDFVPFSKGFFNERGFDILESKDYIKNPKANKYQSFHFRVEILEMLTEIQVRTFRMHDNAENGSSAHKNYKDTILQKFLKTFLYEISGEKRSSNEHIGFLKEITLPNRVWCFTPKEEIPTTPSELKDFADMEFLASIFS